MKEKPLIESAVVPPTRLSRRLRWAAWAVLCVGALAALLIDLLSPPPLAVPDWAADRAYSFEVERIGGKAALYIAQFNRWFFALWHGKSLATTVGVLAVLLAVCFFGLADWVAYPLPPEAPPAHGEGDGQSA